MFLVVCRVSLFGDVLVFVVVVGWRCVLVVDDVALLLLVVCCWLFVV